ILVECRAVNAQQAAGNAVDGLDVIVGGYCDDAKRQTQENVLEPLGGRSRTGRKSGPVGESDAHGGTPAGRRSERRGRSSVADARRREQQALAVAAVNLGDAVVLRAEEIRKRTGGLRF